MTVLFQIIDILLQVASTILFAQAIMSLLLVFSGFSCARPIFTDSVPTPDSHDCCPHSQTAAETVADLNPTFPPCHDGACLQTLDHHVTQYGFTSNQPDPPTPVLLIATELAPDWQSGIRSLSFRAIDPVHPPPLQRSRVLRL